MLIQAFFGGTINTLTVEAGHYYLFDHNRLTEITLKNLLGLAALSGIAALAFFVGIISAIWLAIRMKKDKTPNADKGSTSSFWIRRTDGNKAYPSEKRGQACF
jgi:hypothetical protein